MLEPVALVSRVIRGASNLRTITAAVSFILSGIASCRPGCLYRELVACLWSGTAISN